MSSVPFFLTRLGLDTEADERAVRKAYSRELKLIDQETDAAGFQALRNAYDAAMFWAKQPHRIQILPEAPADHPDPVPVEAATAQQSSPAPDVTEPVPATDSAYQPKLDAGEIFKSPEADAADVFNEFISRFEANSQGLVVLKVPKITENLQGCLEDGRLFNLAARDVFESQLAQRLAGGWRPNHEALLAACAHVFGWKADRRRLKAIPHVGWAMEQAMVEWELFERETHEQSMAVQTQTKELLHQVRYGPLPDRRSVLLNLTKIEAIVGRFPYFMRMVINASNLEAWRKINRDIYAGKMPQPTSPQPVDRQPASGMSGGALILFLVMLAMYLGALNVAKNTEQSRQMTTTSQPANMSRPIAATPYSVISARIAAHVSFYPASTGIPNDPVQFKVDLQPDGRIAGIDKIKSSGLAVYDFAVRKAIEDAAPFAIDDGGRHPSSFLYSRTPLSTETATGAGPAIDVATAQRAGKQSAQNPGTPTAQQLPSPAQKRVMEVMKKRILANMTYQTPKDWARSDPVEYQVILKNNGNIAQVSLKRSSGLPAYDEDLRKALIAAAPYPRDDDGKLFGSFTFFSTPPHTKPAQSYRVPYADVPDPYRNFMPEVPSARSLTSPPPASSAPSVPAVPVPPVERPQQ
jgi:protein TonB